MLDYVNHIKPQISSLKEETKPLYDKLSEKNLASSVRERIGKELCPFIDQLLPLYALSGSVSEEFKKSVCDEGVHIRWMILRDMPEVLGIEGASFEHPWSEDDFIRCLRQGNCIGMVAEHDNLIVGFVIYELHKNKLHVLNFTTNPYYRRMGVGTAMMEKLAGKLSDWGRHRIVLEVGERNLAAQQFFRAEGFKAISVLRDYYDDSVEDAYVMKYLHPTFETRNSPENRISRLRIH